MMKFWSYTKKWHPLRRALVSGALVAGGCVAVCGMYAMADNTIGTPPVSMSGPGTVESQRPPRASEYTAPAPFLTLGAEQRQAAAGLNGAHVHHAIRQGTPPPQFAPNRDRQSRHAEPVRHLPRVEERLSADTFEIPVTSRQTAYPDAAARALADAVQIGSQPSAHMQRNVTERNMSAFNGDLFQFNAAPELHDPARLEAKSTAIPSYVIRSRFDNRPQQTGPIQTADHFTQPNRPNATVAAQRPIPAAPIATHVTVIPQPRYIPQQVDPITPPPVPRDVPNLPPGPAPRPEESARPLQELPREPEPTRAPMPQEVPSTTLPLEVAPQVRATPLVPQSPDVPRTPQPLGARPQDAPAPPHPDPIDLPPTTPPVAPGDIGAGPPETMEDVPPEDALPSEMLEQRSGPRETLPPWVPKQVPYARDLTLLEKVFHPSDPCFDNFISPTTNPFFFEDPRTLTEARLIFANHRTPALVGTPSASIQLYALQLRAALTDRLSLIATKDGYFTSDSAFIDDGWADLSIGMKYNLYRDVCSQRLLSAGLTYEIPVGSTRTLQGDGGGEFHAFVTGMTEILWGGHWISAAGLRIPTDQQDDNEMWYWSNHFDRELVAGTGIYGFTEFTWYQWMSNGSRFPAAVEGGDLFNLGSPNISGNSIVTGAFGLKYKPNRNVETAVAWELPMTDRRGLLDNRLTVDLIVRY